MRRRWLGATASVMVALTSAACSGGDSADVATLPVEPTVATTATVPATEVPATATAATEVATTAAETTVTEAPTTTEVVESSTTTAVPDGFVGLSGDGPWKLVDSAPGVDSPGLVYELMPKLWAFLPTEEVPDDGNLFVPQPQDIPVIEAYLQSRLVFYRATVESPMLFDDPGWAEWFLDGGQTYRESLAPRDADGQRTDLDVGVVLRPYVIGDERTDVNAIVFDCELDGAVWRMPDGSLGPGSTPGVVLDGTETVMKLGENGGWRVAHVAQQELACV